MSQITYREEVKRKLIHLSSLWMPLVMCFFPRWTLCILFAVMLILSMLIEYARSYRVRIITPVYDFFFGKMLREEPKPGSFIISGGPPVYAAAAMVLLLFGNPAAPAAMAVMLMGDSTAALIGRRFGKHKSFNGKSWEGSIGFVVAGWIGAEIMLLLCHVPMYFALWALLASVLASFVELFTTQLHLDDNFSIPLTVGVVISIPVWFCC